MPSSAFGPIRVTSSFEKKIFQETVFHIHVTETYYHKICAIKILLMQWVIFNTRLFS